MSSKKNKKNKNAKAAAQTQSAPVETPVVIDPAPVQTPEEIFAEGEAQREENNAEREKEAEAIAAKAEKDRVKAETAETKRVEREAKAETKKAEKEAKVKAKTEAKDAEEKAKAEAAAAEVIPTSAEIRYNAERNGWEIIAMPEGKVCGKCLELSWAKRTFKDSKKFIKWGIKTVQVFDREKEYTYDPSAPKVAREKKPNKVAKTEAEPGENIQERAPDDAPIVKVVGTGKLEGETQEGRLVEQTGNRMVVEFIMKKDKVPFIYTFVNGEYNNPSTPYHGWKLAEDAMPEPTKANETPTA